MKITIRVEGTIELAPFADLVAHVQPALIALGVDPVGWPVNVNRSYSEREPQWLEIIVSEPGTPLNGE
jgi:hypothetical protein